MIRMRSLTFTLLFSILTFSGLLAQRTTAIYSREDLSRFVRYTRLSAAEDEPVQVKREDGTEREKRESAGVEEMQVQVVLPDGVGLQGRRGEQLTGSDH